MNELAPHETQIDNFAVLCELAKVYPNVDAALARLIELRSELLRPRSTIHVISDIHGEFKKLKHIINNASGSLRPIVEKLFASTLGRKEQDRLLNFLYYPSESYILHVATIPAGKDRIEYLRSIVSSQFEIIGEIAQTANPSHLDRVLPAFYARVFKQLIMTRQESERDALINVLLEEFSASGKEVDLLRMIARLARNLLIGELIVAGDLGDRGARIDKVIDYLMHQPNVFITWGNHDASWLGACLGDLTCIATVLRISLRYRRLSQLEEGYGITMAPLEKLVRSVYSEDPALRFECKGHGLRDEKMMSRMQKAIAIIQFKLEGQAIHRNPQFNLEHRCLLHRMNLSAGTVEIDGKSYKLLDNYFPTLNPQNPYMLSSEEEACMSRLQQSFLESSVLWQQMKFVVSRGSMYLKRDDALIFHACAPVTESGEFLALVVDGVPKKGKELFDALGQIVYRVLHNPRQPDLDMLWYLWSGPNSPWFGKDKMTTFEGYFVAEKETHKETKNPYFKLIHERDFCRRVLQEFNVDPENGLIVNGHVPVKIEEGESPIKKSGLAVTIDGAFSEAYGDKGYTLVIEASGIRLAQHHHFDSVKEALLSGNDIVPEVSIVKNYPVQRTVYNTERGSEIKEKIRLFEFIIDAFNRNALKGLDLSG